MQRQSRRPRAGVGEHLHDAICQRESNSVFPVHGTSVLVAAITALLLGGCQSSPQPRAPKLNVNTAITEGQKKDNASQSINDITSARYLIDGSVALLSTATEERRNGEELVNDTTYFGTLIAVIGVAAKSIAARNVGAGVAGISSATGAHYQLDKQKTAFKKALSSAQCLQSRLNGLDQATYELFPNQILGKDGDTDYDKLYATIPGLTYERYLDIVSQLSDDLDGISTASGSLSEVQGIADAIRDAAKKAEDVKTGGDTGRAQDAQDQLDNADVELSHAKADLTIAQAQANLMPPGRASTAGRDEAAETLAHVLMAQQRLERLQKERDKAAQAADPSAEPKRTAFLLAVVNFKAGAELCTKVSVNK